MISDKENIRLDKFLVEVRPNFSRAQINKLIKSGFVKVNGKSSKAGLIIKIGDKIELEEEGFKEISTDNFPAAKEIDFEVLYENKDFAVINKPHALSVHPARKGDNETLVSGLLNRFEKLSDVGGKNRPGIVHRLDKETSGVLIVAKNNEAHLSLKEEFKQRKIKKTYFAIVWGKLNTDHAFIDSPIARHPKNRLKMSLSSEGKNAVTEFWCEKKWKNFSFLKVNLITGRTHQIRIHLASIGYPVFGDSLYASKKQLEAMQKEAGCDLTLMLHSKEIEFEYKKERYKFTAPLPSYFENFLAKFN